MVQQQRKKVVIPHIEWLDLHQDGMLHEVAVMKRDKLGNTHYIKIEELDHVDRKRLATILRSRNAPSFELWDLLAQNTLGNGLNALEYFHQLVKVCTVTGQIYSPSTSRIGYKKPSLTERPVQVKKK